MRGRATALAIVLLLLASGLTVLASSGWTPQGNPESQGEVYKAHILTVPTITAYGIFPVNAEIGTLVQCWLTYTDADNDAPTYVRCERSTMPSTVGLQIPVNTMAANDSGDTTYSDGKQYYFNWYYFPFCGTGFIAFMVKSGADAQVTKFVVAYQEPAPKLKHSGVTPMNNTEGNYTFFSNFTDQFNGIPGYVRVVIDGISHNMGKNNSSQVSWITGVDYNYTTNLTVGNHTYSFHATSQYNKSGEQSTGVFWLIIRGLSFLSTPGTNATANQTYEYQAFVNNPNWNLTWTLDTNASGLFVNQTTGYVNGTIKVAGSYWINLTAISGSIMVWQNWTLSVIPDPAMAYANLVLGMVFGFGLIALCFIDRKRTIWPTFTGFVWLALSVVVFYPFGLIWMVCGIGIGLILMLEGSMAYASGRKQGAD